MTAIWFAIGIIVGYRIGFLVAAFFADYVGGGPGWFKKRLPK